jgi:hypothetical protein
MRSERYNQQMQGNCQGFRSWSPGRLCCSIIDVCRMESGIWNPGLKKILFVTAPRFGNLESRTQEIVFVAGSRDLGIWNPERRIPFVTRRSAYRRCFCCSADGDGRWPVAGGRWWPEATKSQRWGPLFSLFGEVSLCLLL